ncbi:L-fuculose-phosphate aldolase [Cetobacterium sp.]|uniref:L-fuculose-phosphate aldolase n=1 Tax=Cetobacterium sp. TaxID=2071632 RepID=UPI003F337C86
MLLEQERKELIIYGKKMITENLTKGTGGNLSIFNREKNLMAITPSGIDYFDIKPEDVVIIDVATGNIIDGNKVPSSECDMHRIFYKYRNDINAVVHTHSIFSTTISCLNINLPPIHYILATAGVDVRCAKYATYGTVKLAKNAFEAMKDRNAALLANHGLITGGNSLKQAFSIALDVEFCSELFCKSKAMGEPVSLKVDEMKSMIERFKNYGKRIEEHEKI